MGDFPAWDPNKQLFDQSQQTNPYSLFAGQALPWPTPPNLGGLSAPTDAMGRPIASYQAPQPTRQWVPGTTINSGGGGGGGSYLEQQLQGWSALDPTGVNLAAIMPGSAAAQAQASMPLGQRMANAQSGNFAANMPGQGTPTPGSWQTVQPSAADMSAAYLNALGNPGKVTTQGATVAPAAQAYQPSNNGVLDAFLANQKATGWNGGRGSPALNILDQMRQMHGGGSSTSGN